MQEQNQTAEDAHSGRVYLLAGPIMGSWDVQSRLDRWTICRPGPLCWAGCGYA